MKEKTKLNLEQFSRRLIEERDGLEQEIGPPAGLAEPVADSEKIRPATGPLIEQFKAVEAGVARIKSDRLEQINDALERIDDGTYGTCSSCGKMINVRRLEADPSAVRCIDCASANESGFKAPTL